MANYLQNLITHRDKIAQELADVSFANAAVGAHNAGGSPNTSGDGINADHQGYLRQLQDSLKAANAEIDIERNRSSGDMFQSVEV